MPTVRKLSPDEVRTIEKRIKGQRKLVEEEYDALLRDYGEGDYGEAELGAGENRITVRNRLKSAALRRDLSLDFKRTKGNVLRFHVVSSNGTAAKAPQVMHAPHLPVEEPEKSRRGRRKKM